MRQTCLPVALILGTCLNLGAAEQQPAGSISQELAQQIFGMTDLVLQNHIDPPTRQEMILQGIKATLRRAGKRPPIGLSRRVSGISNKADLAALLKELAPQLKGGKQDLANAFTGGLLSAVAGRPYLISAEQLRVNGSLQANQYVGTGIVLRMDKRHGPMMPKVFFDGPAWKAGAKGGDIIVSIDGDPARQMPLQTVLRRLRGAKGTLVTVEVRRPGSQQVRKLEITRNVAFIPTIEGYSQTAPGQWEYTTGKEKKIAYLRIHRIGSSTAFELKQIAVRLQKENLVGVILDLRFGGGALHDTILLANSLLHSGTIGHVQYSKTRTTHSAKPGALFHNVPMVVLTQRDMNGDRLFLTAALQDNKRAKVVGEPTRSDAFVRRPIAVPNAAFSIVLPTGVLLRGNGQPLMSPRIRANQIVRAKPSKNVPPRGIVPDVRVPLTDKKLVFLQRAYAFTTPGLKKPQPDPHVKKAIELLEQQS